MKEFHESGLTLTFESDSVFRFGSLSGYKKLSHLGIKEFDFGLENEAGMITLIELKQLDRDLTNNRPFNIINLTDEEPAEKMNQDIARKSVGSLLMLGSEKFIRDNLQASSAINESTTIHLIVIFNSAKEPMTFAGFYDTLKYKLQNLEALYPKLRVSAGHYKVFSDLIPGLTITTSMQGN